MSIPSEPKTRAEMYLNAIAMGDSSGVPATPYTREEMYLDAIAKGGGGSSGGGVLVVSVGENNVCDKTYNDVKTAVEAGMIVALKVPGPAPTDLPGFYYFSYGGFEPEFGAELSFNGAEQQITSSTATDPLVWQG